MAGWSWTQLAMLGAAGLAGGFVNTLAGGGSLVTLPALLLLGLPADVANATNRVGVLAQSIVAARGLGRDARLADTAKARVLVPALAGALAGAWIAARTPPGVLKPILLATLVVIAATLVWKPHLLVAHAGESPLDPRDRPLGVAGLFVIGAYGGFLQIGVGIVLLVFLGSVLRYDLLLGNALKSLVVAALTLVALAVFALAGQVWWLPGALMSLATVAGARLGVRFARERGHDAIRKVLFVTVLAACAAVALKHAG
jgi:uncharacterized membrane protein YfcA